MGLKPGSFFVVPCGTTEVVPFPVNFKVKGKIKVNGSGQECPLHTEKARTPLSGLLLATESQTMQISAS